MSFNFFSTFVVGRARMEETLDPPSWRLPYFELRRRVAEGAVFDQELIGTTEYLGIEMPARAANALQNVRLFAEFDRMNWARALFDLPASSSFSTRRLRPETEETMRQKLLRMFTGLKVYPVDTRMAEAKNREEILKPTKIRIWKERQAKRREARERE